MSTDHEEPAFRSIGILTQRIANSQPNADATRTRPPTPSATTGTPAPAPGASNSTGTPHGADGAVAKASAPDPVAAAMASDTERDAKAVLVRSLAHYGLRPVEASSSSFGSDGQFDALVTRIDLAGANPHALTAAWELIGPLCMPASTRPGGDAAILRAWTMVKAATVNRPAEGDDAELMNDMILDECGRYPLDCVLRALRTWRQGRKFRPSLSEVLSEVQWRAKWREALRDAFRREGVA